MAALFLGAGSPSVRMSSVPPSTFPGLSLVGLTGSSGPVYGAFRLNGIDATNDGDYPVFLQLFNSGSVSGITLGTTKPLITIKVPAADTSGLNWDSGSLNKEFGVGGPNFGAGMVIAATKSSEGADLAYPGDIKCTIRASNVGVT